MKTNNCFLILMLFLSFGISAQDWNGIPVPANAGSGKTWQLQSNVSDSFDYISGGGNRPAAFTSKWTPSYINGWTGPGATIFNGDQAWTNGSELGIQAQPAGGGKSFNGIISSKNYIQYPVYMEVRAKIMDQVLANAFWTLNDAETQEIDIMEGYGSDRGGTYFSQRMHLSHHTFIRQPFTDYQPMGEDTWYYNGGVPWRADYHRYGCYWKDPWNLEYYIDGKKVHTITRDRIDPNNHLNGTGLNDRTRIIIDCENQTAWRPVATQEELADDSKNIFWIDWIRVYKPVNGGGGTPPPPPPPNPTPTPTPPPTTGCNLPRTLNNIVVNKQTVNYSSGAINISCASNVTISMTAQGSGPMENADFLNVYYKVNGGQQIAISENNNSFGAKTVSASGINGNTVELIVNGFTSFGDETYTVSNILISGNGSAPNPNPNPAPGGNSTLVIEAENFNQTGGTFNDGQVPLGMNKTGVGVNFVNSGDWAEYNINVANAGSYAITYRISTPSDNAQVQFVVDGNVVATDNVPNNGQWDSYVNLNSSQRVNLSQGNHTIRINASGSNDWQWNMDKITLSGGGNKSIAVNEVKVYPNPANSSIQLVGTKEYTSVNIYDLLGKKVLSQRIEAAEINVSALKNGVYMMELIGNNSNKFTRIAIRH